MVALRKQEVVGTRQKARSFWLETVCNFASMRTYLLVAAGGALGSVLRYGMARMLPRLQPGTFPWATFCINLLGCLLIGLLAGKLDKSAWLQSTGWALLATGFCGGFTTFSTFALENIQLLREQDLALAILYTTLSLTGGLLLCVIGQKLAA